MADVAFVIAYVALFAPLIFVQVAPFNTCHWYDTTLLATMEKLAFPPRQVAVAAGCEVITGS